MTHICASKLNIIGSDNGLSPDRYQVIIRTNAAILLISPLGTNFSEILTEIHTFSFKKTQLNMSSAKCGTFCLGLNVLQEASWPHMPLWIVSEMTVWYCWGLGEYSITTNIVLACKTLTHTSVCQNCMYIYIYIYYPGPLSKHWARVWLTVCINQHKSGSWENINRSQATWW